MSQTTPARPEPRAVLNSHHGSTVTISGTTSPPTRGASGDGHGRWPWHRPDITQIVTDLYDGQGLSMRQIAKHLRCSYGTANKLVHAAGLKVRSRGGPRPPRQATAMRSTTRPNRR